MRIKEDLLFCPCILMLRALFVDLQRDESIVVLIFLCSITVFIPYCLSRYFLLENRFLRALYQKVAKPDVILPPYAPSTNRSTFDNTQQLNSPVIVAKGTKEWQN